MKPGCETFYIETFGCQMNERDSETISALLSQNGMTATGDLGLADVIILNTCAVRESAEAKVWSRLGRIRSNRRSGRKDDPIYVLAGCMAQLPHNLERAKRRVPYLDILVGPGNIHEIPHLVETARSRRNREAPTKRSLITAVSPARSLPGDERVMQTAQTLQALQSLPEGLPRSSSPGVTSHVNIMYGCDNFCTYCVVPYVRGHQFSREPGAVADEVRCLVEKGCKEVTLLGQNVNAFGLDKGGFHGFAHLLYDLDKIPGLLRIRYFSSHPRDFTREMVDAVKDCPKVCEHFHLPLQSGSDRVLKAMNRGYTKEEYLELAEYVKQTVEGASITTDIIVGFPGETEEDFEETLDVVRQVDFDGAFTFIFSPRSGTGAAKMTEQCSKEDKSRRLQELVRVQSEITRRRNRLLLGEEVEILVEGPHKSHEGAVTGRTRNGKSVIGIGEACTGDLVRVQVTEAGTWYLKGSVVR